MSCQHGRPPYNTCALCEATTLATCEHPQNRRTFPQFTALWRDDVACAGFPWGPRASTMLVTSPCHAKHVWTTNPAKRNKSVPGCAIKNCTQDGLGCSFVNTRPLLKCFPTVRTSGLLVARCSTSMNCTTRRCKKTVGQQFY